MTNKVVKMPDYSKGKIYCIKSYQTDKVYYGSTCEDLNIRFNGHKCDSNIKTLTSSQILQYTDAYIELVEEFPCNTKAELHNRERYYIENNPCVNKNIPGRTDKEYYEANKEKRKEYLKLWYLANRDRRMESMRLYYHANK
jgi:hypothetical protein